jgi:hypothetical protein
MERSQSSRDLPLPIHDVLLIDRRMAQDGNRASGGFGLKVRKLLPIPPKARCSPAAQARLAVALIEKLANGTGAAVRCRSRCTPRTAAPGPAYRPQARRGFEHRQPGSGPCHEEGDRASAGIYARRDRRRWQMFAARSPLPAIRSNPPAERRARRTDYTGRA